MAAMLYLFLKDAHSVLRWLVILTAVWALVRAWGGLLSRRTWAKADRISGLAFSSVLNLQVLLGIALYAVSPITHAAMTNFAAAMKDNTLRFFAVEHVTGMILAAILAQIGFSASKRATDDRARFRKAAIFYTAATVILLLSIPWPFLPYGRPLLPGFGG
jgi:hypothetical protein